VLLIFKSGQIIVCDRGKKKIYVKEKRSKWTVRIGQLVCDVDRRIL